MPASYLLDDCSMFARRLLDVCSMFARSCERGIRYAIQYTVSQKTVKIVFAITLSNFHQCPPHQIYVNALPVIHKCFKLLHDATSMSPVNVVTT